MGLEHDPSSQSITARENHTRASHFLCRRDTHRCTWNRYSPGGPATSTFSNIFHVGRPAQNVVHRYLATQITQSTSSHDSFSLSMVYRSGLETNDNGESCRRLQSYNVGLALLLLCFLLVILPLGCVRGPFGTRSLLNHPFIAVNNLLYLR